MSLKGFKYSVAIACAAAGFAILTPAFAQQAVMKECGDKWQKAKAANQTGNQTWPQFLSKCRADSAKPAAAAAKPEPAKAAAKPAPAKAAAKPAAAAATTAAPKGMIFPKKIDAKYKDLSPGLQRNKTCADQYNANKTAGGKGNGGLLYIPKEKGGQGYWPLCNAALKG
ncbi:MAG: hypothetical protein AB7F96_15335 [Beijerinckiaceae bacterium]